MKKNVVFAEKDKKENKYITLVSNTAIFAISNILSKVLLSLLLPLYTRTLSTAEYGTAELVTTISQLIIPVCSLSVQDAVFRYAMDKEKRATEVLKVANNIMLFASIAMAVLSFGLRYYEAIAKWVGFFYIISVLTMYRSILSLYSKAINNTRLFSIDSVLYNLILALCNICFLAVFNWKLEGYFGAIIIANIFSIVFLSIKSKAFQGWKEVSLNKDLRKEMLRYSMPLILNSISWGLTHVVNRVMLTAYLSASASGIYSAASKIPSILSLITGVFTQAWTLSMIQDYETEKDKKFYSNVFLITHIAVVGATFLILLVNNSILPVVLGKEFEDAVSYVPLLLIGTVFLTYSNYYSSVYAAMKESKKIMISSFGGAIINIILNVVLIPSCGILGACIATAASYIYIGIYRMWDCQRCFPIERNVRKLFVSISLLVIATISAMTEYKTMGVVVCTTILFCGIYYKTLKNIIDNIFRLISRRGKTK